MYVLSVVYCFSQVREKFYKMVGNWLMHLPDRFDFEVCAPLILSLSCHAEITRV